jgi:branched-chain amino acid transport system ATP-binding protein
MDEPSEGIQPSMLDTIVEVIQRLMKKETLSILGVEQNLDCAAEISHRGHAMETGRIV